MAISSRATQDRRNISRLLVCLDCQFTYSGVTHKAVVVDFSLKGAYVSSSFLPPKDAVVTVNLISPVNGKPLEFNGTVIRGTWAMSDHDKIGRFGIRFDYASAELIALIAKMNS
jgi:hypothetical protein